MADELGKAESVDPDGEDVFLLVAIRTNGEQQLIAEQVTTLLEGFAIEGRPNGHVMCQPPEDITGSQRVFLANLLTLGKPDGFQTLDPLQEQET